MSLIVFLVDRHYSFVISCDRVDYIFSTVHKFKGLECDSVSLLFT